MRRRLYRYYLFSLIFLSAVCCLRPAFSFAAAYDRTIRVAIAQDVDSFYIRIKGNFEMRELANNRLILKGKGLKKQKASVRVDKITALSFILTVSRVQIVPIKGACIYLNNRLYRGKINLIRKDKEHVLITNELGVEDYVRGILCKEIAPWWPLDALKSQAIIARTYAFYQKQFPKDKDFEVTDDIYSQVYGGKTSERWRTNRAVDRTRGKILTFGGKVFPAYYHATCGGQTEDASELWNISLTPLKGVACGFCSRSPHYQWQQKIPLSSVQARLIEKGYLCPEEIESVEIIARNNSRRVTRLRVKGLDKNLELTSKDFRQALEPNVIRSTNFSLEIIDGSLHIAGFGWGHGVGLCQWGMYYMAKAGYSSEQILKYYFPQSELSTFR